MHQRTLLLAVLNKFQTPQVLHEPAARPIPTPHDSLNLSLTDVRTTSASSWIRWWNRCKDDFREFVDTLVVALRGMEKSESPPAKYPPD